MNIDVIKLGTSKKDRNITVNISWIYGENDLPVRVFDMVSSSLFVLLADADDKALIVLVIITVTFEAPSLPLPKLNTPESAWKATNKVCN